MMSVVESFSLELEWVYAFLQVISYFTEIVDSNVS